MDVNTVVKAGVAVVLITAGTVLGSKAIEQAGEDLMKKKD